MMLSTASPSPNMLHRNNNRSGNRKRGAPPKFTDQLSGARPFTVSLSPMEDHLASLRLSPNGRRREERPGVGGCGVNPHDFHARERPPRPTPPKSELYIDIPTPPAQ